MGGLKAGNSHDHRIYHYCLNLANFILRTIEVVLIPASPAPVSNLNIANTMKTFANALEKPNTIAVMCEAKRMRLLPYLVMRHWGWWNIQDDEENLCQPFKVELQFFFVMNTELTVNKMYKSKLHVCIDTPHIFLNYCMLKSSKSELTSSHSSFILVREVSKDCGPDHHSKEEDGARGFYQALSVTDEVPLKKKKADMSEKES